MIRTFRAEFVKLLRRRVLLLTAAVTLLAAVGGSAIVLAAAEPAAHGGPGRSVTLEELARAGGGTDVFRIVASFTGTFLFVVFVGIVAIEFSRGTMRTMLLRQPRRVRLLAGKLAALLTFAAVTLAAGEIVTWIAARALAPSNDVSTSAWTSAHALGAAVGDYGAVLLWVTGYAVFGTMVAVLLRSVPVALGVGIAWAGPMEHLVQDAWSPANRLFPGLLLEAFVGGGNADVSSGRALVTVSAYAIVAGAIAATVFARRDVTA
jgi:ABC-2 type transport system permease protein